VAVTVTRRIPGEKEKTGKAVEGGRKKGEKRRKSYRKKREVSVKGQEYGKKQVRYRAEDQNASHIP